MRFYGREKEMSELKDIRERSLISSTFTVVTGRRRIGKTTLMLRSAEGHKHVYLFVSRTNEPILCERMQSAVEEAGIDIIGKTTAFRDLFKAMMIHSCKEPLTVIIDEFQDFDLVDPSIFSAIQEIWDTYHDRSHMNLIVGGSVHSMMVRIFEDEKQPLFGRATSKMVLRPFTTAQLKNILHDHDPEASHRDLLTLYMLTGGVPKYVSILMDADRTKHEAMLDHALSVGSVFLSDGRDLLVTEFGRDHKTYFTILALISQGKNRRPQIDEALGMETGMYLKRLESEFSFIGGKTPVFSKANSRNMQWEVTDVYLRFYFRFIEPSMGFIESGRHDLLRRYIESGLEKYEGQVLEDYLRRKLSEEWTYTEIGRYWNRKGDVEIDIVVLDSISHKATFVEVKRNPSKPDMRVLSEKVDTLKDHLHGYDVDLLGMSMDDV